jgi:acetyl-CoA hydrolase
MNAPFPTLSADEAAALIQNGETVGFSGFTPAGAVKAVPRALAARARAEHTAGRPFKIGVVTGASTGPSLDGELAQADAVLFRTPYQSDPHLRASINAGRTRFFDMHLSLLPQYVRYGFFGPLHWAVVEACDVRPNGEITLTTSVGASDTFCLAAKKILIEWNAAQPTALRGFHDIYEPTSPPRRREVPVYHCSDRIGTLTVQVDPSKIAGIIHTNLPDETGGFDTPDAVTAKIGANVAEFLAAERRAGRIPAEFLPIQSGVGNIANAVLGALGEHPEIPPFEMYSEVIQDAVIELMRAGHITFARATSLTLSAETRRAFFADLEQFRPKIVLRPQEISNNPEIIRRLGVITINTALEVDLFGNVNSTHVLGKNLMNGIGGSGDFTRSAYISIFVCPSLAKGGKITPIVPCVSHVDHSEHSVQAIITEQGVADLRCKDPIERARLIIENCAHPSFRPVLRDFLEQTKDGHTPQSLGRAYALHQRFMECGDMLAR